MKAFGIEGAKASRESDGNGNQPSLEFQAWEEGRWLSTSGICSCQNSRRENRGLQMCTSKPSTVFFS